MDFRECFLRKFHISREMLLEVIKNHKCLVQVNNQLWSWLLTVRADRLRVGLGRVPMLESRG